ncbi:MAG: flagellar FliJ family protein [Armatimonadetes bacterium]|nr:flagellar FliJ family protein [Armatimonadota bacterium]
MAKFQFRLQRVLDFREMAEEWAKNDYLERRAARLLAEQERVQIAGERKNAIGRGAESLDARRNLEMLLSRYDEEEAIQLRIIAELEEEEERAAEVWREKKQELEAMVKLRDKALEEWTLEDTRREQAELDEWAVLRRKAA